MRDILANEIEATIRRETADRCATRHLLEAADLTEQSKAMLAGELQICLETAFDLYIEARSVGYRPGIRRLDAARGEHWRRTSGANTQGAKRAWTRALGNPFFSDIEREDVILALEKIRNLPKGHGKRPNSAAENGDRTSPDRIGVTTFLRIGRTARQVGDFLVELNLEDANPFDICSWSTAEEACLRQQERPSETREWSEAVESYLSSPIFKGDMRDTGDPLFWIPLLMRFGGLRLDEAVHLTIRDLQYRDGMPVICIDRYGKTPAARREIPVTRRLQDLGLVDLFELRRDQKETLLFPQLAEGRAARGSGRISFATARRTGSMLRPFTLTISGEPCIIHCSNRNARIPWSEAPWVRCLEIRPASFSMTTGFKPSSRRYPRLARAFRISSARTAER